MAAARRIRERLERGGFPWKRVGAVTVLTGAALVALVLFWVLTDSDPAPPESAIVCLPAEDGANEGGTGDTSHSVPAGSQSVAAVESPAPRDPVPLVSSAAIANVDASSAAAVSPGGPAPLVREQAALPLFAQNQGPWAANEYDHHTQQAPQHAWCGTSIAQCGCAMTSLGNVLSLFNIVSTPDGDQLDPGTLDSWLGRDAQLTEGGWISKGYFYGDVVWTDIATYTAQLQATNPDAVRLRFRGRGSGSVEEIRAELEAGRPVILSVEIDGARRRHQVATRDDILPPEAVECFEQVAQQDATRAVSDKMDLHLCARQTGGKGLDDMHAVAIRAV